MKPITNDLNESHFRISKTQSQFFPRKESQFSSYSQLSVTPNGILNQFSEHPNLFSEFSDTIFQEVPELIHIVLELKGTFYKNRAPFKALQFVPVLKGFSLQDRDQKKRIAENPAHRHILIQNGLLKVVLIYWNPGDYSPIHGHPAGGCVFKVLSGKLEEKRYSPDTEQHLLAVSKYRTGSMGYIDDIMAYHAVGNPFKEPAISIHAYTPGT